MTAAGQSLSEFTFHRAGEDVRRSIFIVAVLVLAVARPAVSEPLTLKHAVELALAHSPLAAQTNADEQRAFASMQEARYQYLPQVAVGSGLGDSWGYPLSLEGSAPSLVNITAQSALFNPALREFVRSARQRVPGCRRHQQRPAQSDYSGHGNSRISN